MDRPTQATYLHELADARADHTAFSAPEVAVEPVADTAAVNLFDAYGGIASASDMRPKDAGRSVAEAVHAVVDSFVVPAMSGAESRLRGRSRGLRVVIWVATAAIVITVAASLIHHGGAHRTKAKDAKPKPRALAPAGTGASSAPEALIKGEFRVSPVHPRPRPHRRGRRRSRPRPRTVPTTPRRPVRTHAPAPRPVAPAVATPKPAPAVTVAPPAPVRPSRPRSAPADEFGFER